MTDLHSAVRTAVDEARRLAQKAADTDEMNCLQAEQKVKAFAKSHNWNKEDTTLVLQVLGLVESPPPLRVVSRR